MSRAEIAAAIQRGAVERAARESARAHEAEAKRMREDRRRREWGEMVAAQRAYLEAGALYALIEEVEARGGVDTVVYAGDGDLITLLVPSEQEPDLGLLLEALNGIEGIHGRMLGEFLEIAWDREA